MGKRRETRAILILATAAALLIALAVTATGAWADGVCMDDGAGDPVTHGSDPPTCDATAGNTAFAAGTGDTTATATAEDGNDVTATGNGSTATTGTGDENSATAAGNNCNADASGETTDTQTGNGGVNGTQTCTPVP